MADFQYNWGITGHEKQLRELENDLLSGNIPHAYLFAGPSSIGKFSLARKLAQFLQCDRKDCNNCATCRQIAAGYHAETIVFPDDGKTISIESIRDVLRRLSTTTTATYKIFLAKNIERMTLEAANALLKTLEDPPPQVLFLLTTSHPNELLKTILSRVRIFMFSGLPEKKLLEFLEAALPEASDDDRRLAAELSLGRPGKALTLLRNDTLLGHYKEMYQRLCGLIDHHDMASRFEFVAEISKDDQFVEDFFDLFVLALRCKMLGDSSCRTHKRADIALLLGKAIHAKQLLKRNVNGRLLMENLMLHI